jgi:nucleoside-diphosphate-sugar epimerase
MRVLITGASGFIGGALLGAQAHRHAFTALGRAAPPPQQSSTVSADLADPASVRDALRSLEAAPRFDAILHLAVSRFHRLFPEQALDMFHVNTTVTAELLDFARRTGVPHVVLASTGNVYAADGAAEGDSHASREGEFTPPRSCFAASKLFADALGELYRGQFAVTVLRFYAPYGPGLRDRLLADLVARVRDGRPITLPEGSSGLRFAAVHVDDAVAVIERSLEERWNETVNVAAPEAWSIAEAGRLIGELLSKPALFEVSATAGAAGYLPDTTRLQARMRGYEFIGLREGLRGMIAAG